MQQYLTDGTRLDFTQDVLADFNPWVLLGNLSKENRFSNNVEVKVLDHMAACGLAAQLLKADTATTVLAAFHDIQEAVVRDVPTPFKRYIGQKWEDMEQLIQDKILTKLGLLSIVSNADKELVRKIDSTMLVVELLNKLGRDSEMYQFFANRYPVDPDVYTACLDAYRYVERDKRGSSELISPRVRVMYERILALGSSSGL